MTGFDFAVVAILLISVALGVKRGLVYEVLSLLGWPVAFLLSKSFAGSIVFLMPVSQEMMRIMLAYVVMFIVALIVWGVLTWLLSRFVKAIGLGWLDRSLGGVIGILRGILVILVMVWLAGLTNIPEQPIWHNAYMSKTAENVALQTKSWLPDRIGKHIHYGKRS